MVTVGPRNYPKMKKSFWVSSNGLKPRSSWKKSLIQDKYISSLEEKIKILETENQNKIIEMAVFLDLAGYNRLSQLYSDEEIESVVLAYINQVAALYHIPSLGQQIDITITYLGKL